MQWEQQLQYASMTDIGFRRQNNEDACAVRVCPDKKTWRQHGHLFLVADGMGGHAVGELASKITADMLPHMFFKSQETDVQSSLHAAIAAVNTTIHERGLYNRDFQRMGTTCTALVLSREGAVIGHVGDSRVYRIRGDRIDQLTFDHSLQWELLRLGKMKPEEIFIHEPRHVITRSLGPESEVKVDIEGPYEVLPGDIYLLCSDGLTGHLNDSEIGTIAHELPPGEACRLLVQLANLRGGSDNITVVTVRVGDVPEGVAERLSHYTDPPDRPLRWWWLASVWLVSITFVSGVCLSLLGKYLEGLTMTALAAFAAVGMFAYWLEKRSRDESPATESRLDETAVWRVYRTASAKLNRKFLIYLASLESELQRTATEEGWAIDWQEHESAYALAKKSLGGRDYSLAFALFSRVIDILMAGLNEYRRQQHRDAKWGKPAATPARSKNSRPPDAAGPPVVDPASDLSEAEDS